METKMSQNAEEQRQYQIALSFDDRHILIQGVTNYTTCSDVIKMVLKKFPFYSKKSDVSTQSLKIFESSRAGDKLLAGKKKILKVMRSWSTARDSELVMRRVSDVKRNETSVARKRTIDRLEPEGCVAGRHPTPAKPHRIVCTNLNSVSRTRDLESSLRLNNKAAQLLESTTFSSPNEAQLRAKLGHDSTIQKDGNTPRQYKAGHRPTSLYGSENKQEHGYKVCLSSTACVQDISRNVTGRSDVTPNLANKRNITRVRQSEEVKYAVKKNLKANFETVVRSVSQYRNVGEFKCEKNTTYTKSVDNHKKLAQSIHTQIANMDQREGKEAILNKYFADYLLYQSPTLPSAYRRRGDGAENCNGSDSFRRGDGSSFTDLSPCTPVYAFPNDEPLDLSKFKGVANDKINYTKNMTFDKHKQNMESIDGKEENAGHDQHFLHFHQSFPKHFQLETSKQGIVCERVEVPHFNSPCSDKYSDATSDSGHVGNECDAYDNAHDDFNNEFYALDNKLDFDVSFISANEEDSDLNAAFVEEETAEYDVVRRLVDYSLTESDISDIEHDDERELSRMSSVSDFVKSVFTDNAAEDEDEELDSFMKTKLSDDITDEGLSSLGSDFET